MISECLPVRRFEFEFIGVLRLMQRHFSHKIICDGTDVQAD